MIPKHQQINVWMNMSETLKKKKARLRYDNVFKTAWTNEVHFIKHSRKGNKFAFCEHLNFHYRFLYIYYITPTSKFSLFFSITKIHTTVVTSLWPPWLIKKSVLQNSQNANLFPFRECLMKWTSSVHAILNTLS
jgi:hypothetical protein